MQQINYKNSKWSILFTIISILSIISIIENALTDLYFSPGLKQLLLILVFLLAGLVFVFNFRYLNIIVVKINLIAIFLATVSVILRVISHSDIDLYAVFRDLFHIISVAMIVMVSTIFLKRSIAVKGSKFKAIFLLILLSMAPLSFLGYIINPSTGFSFFDNQGHLLHLVYTSFSSSLYRLDSIQFARMSLIFDEPGTFGLFCTLLSSILFILQQRLSKSGVIVLVVGLSSVSLAFNIYLLLFLTFVIFYGNSLSFSINKMLLYILLLILFASFLILPFDIINNDFGGYLLSRFESIFSGNNNRSDGNSLALRLLSESPFGLNEISFEQRVLSSSGILVLSAYKGILYSVSFVLIYISFFIAVMNFSNIKPLLILPLFLALAIALLSRNNFFNISGPVLLLFAIYCGTFFSKTNINKSPY